MKKILAFLISMFLLTALSAEAKAVKKDLSNIIDEFGVDKDSISISIKNADNGKNIYSLNDKILMNPALFYYLSLFRNFFQTISTMPLFFNFQIQFIKNLFSFFQVLCFFFRIARLHCFLL